MNDSLSLILLAGGTGQRMQSVTPKQYLTLGNQPIALLALKNLVQQVTFQEIIVVCEKQWLSLFESLQIPIKIAQPGKTRQESVYNGLCAIEDVDSLVFTHDSARPFPPPLAPLLDAARTYGAAVFGIPVHPTIKTIDTKGFVVQTLDRRYLVDTQTPQAARYTLLQQGFEKAKKTNATVTDDMSLIELIGHLVKVVPGSHKNLKITSAEDLQIAQLWAQELCLNTDC